MVGIGQRSVVGAALTDYWEGVATNDSCLLLGGPTTTVAGPCLLMGTSSGMIFAASKLVCHKKSPISIDAGQFLSPFLKL